MTMIGGVGEMFLLVPAHTGCPGQNPESHKTVVVVVVVVGIIITASAAAVVTTCV